MQYFLLLSTMVVAPLLSDAIYDAFDLGSSATTEDLARLIILMVIFLGTMFYLFVSPLRNSHVKVLMLLYTLSVIVIPAWGYITREMLTERDGADASIIQWVLIGVIIAIMTVFVIYTERSKLLAFKETAQNRMSQTRTKFGSMMNRRKANKQLRSRQYDFI